MVQWKSQEAKPCGGCKKSGHDGVCSRCSGGGYEAQVGVCPDCSGSGTRKRNGLSVPETYEETIKRGRDEKGVLRVRAAKCLSCAGTGQSKPICNRCQGSGVCIGCGGSGWVYPPSLF